MKKIVVVEPHPEMRKMLLAGLEKVIRVEDIIAYESYASALRALENMEPEEVGAIFVALGGHTGEGAGVGRTLMKIMPKKTKIFLISTEKAEAVAYNYGFDGFIPKTDFIPKEKLVAFFKMHYLL